MKKYKIIYADPPWSYKNGGVPQGGGKCAIRYNEIRGY
jgi:hypothetical protein